MDFEETNSFNDTDNTENLESVARSLFDENELLRNDFDSIFSGYNEY